MSSALERACPRPCAQATYPPALLRSQPGPSSRRTEAPYAPVACSRTPVPGSVPLGRRLRCVCKCWRATSERQRIKLPCSAHRCAPGLPLAEPPQEEVGDANALTASDYYSVVMSICNAAGEAMLLVFWP